MKMIKNTLFSEKPVNIGPESGYDNYIMAIESSCDETACAIVKNGREVISNVVASQIKTHAQYGGVITGKLRPSKNKSIKNVYQ